MAYSPVEFVHNGIRLLGLSVAGEESYVVAPELNVAFDCGRGAPDVLTVDHVLLSHGHMDHAAGVAYYFAQRMFIDNRPGTVYAPAPLVEPLHRLLRAWADIDGHEPPANITPAVPGQDLTLRRDLVVRPFEVNHPCRRHDRSIVRALGYCVLEVRQKLLDEFAGLAGPEIVALKKQGREVTRRVEVPLVAYCGDTANGDFFGLDYVRTARVLLLECTFIEPDHVERARAGYHIHLTDLRDILPRLANERILLTHLSRRTALNEAKKALRAELGDLADPRVLFLMDQRRPRRPGSNAPAPAVSEGPRPA